MKPKTDKQGWWEKVSLQEWLEDFVESGCELEDLESLLDQQREEVVEEVRDWIEQNRDERPDKLFNTDSKGGNYELGRRDENIVLINELVKILDKLALSSDGEKKGTK